jgi:CRP/FNR family transcriptional regulator, cyclic AMP receptor protein
VSTILDLCDGLPATSFKKGDVLLAEGTHTGMLYILVDGAVEILKGDFQIDVVSEPGALFGEVSALLDIPHMATVRILNPSRVYRIEHAVEFLNNYPMVALEVARLLAQRLNGVTNYLVDLKNQFEDQKGHLGMVDEVLETLLHQQRDKFVPGSDRDPDTSI